MLLGHNPSHSFSFFSSSFFFLVTYCRVECNFLTLKISDWGAPTFRRQTGCRSRRERSEGWMMRKMKASESERGRGRSRERKRVIHSRVRVGRTRAKKNRGLKGRITSGILVFAFHLDEKPISRFSVFPATRTGTRIRCLLCEYRDESERDRYYVLPLPLPTSWRRILSRVRSFNRVCCRNTRSNILDDILSFEISLNLKYDR